MFFLSLTRMIYTVIVQMNFGMTRVPTPVCVIPPNVALCTQRNCHYGITYGHCVYRKSEHSGDEARQELGVN